MENAMRICLRSRDMACVLKSARPHGMWLHWEMFGGSAQVGTGIGDIVVEPLELGLDQDKVSLQPVIGFAFENAFGKQGFLQTVRHLVDDLVTDLGVELLEGRDG